MSEPSGDGRPARSYRVEALAKGLRLLSYFSAESPALSVKDLVTLSGIPMPTVFRLVATLEQEGYLERTVDGRVRPGTGVLALGFAALQGLDVVQTSSTSMRELAASTGETVNLGVLYHDQVLFVARIQRSNTILAADIRVGSTVPAVFSSIGKVILAHMAEEELGRYISGASFQGTWGPRAVRTMDALQTQLAAARRDGYLVQRDEAIPGLSSIAAPIRQSGGGVAAAINVAVPSAEYPNRQLVDRLLPPLLAASREISRRMGGPGN
ncbi:MAG TPA: IclR family transcriptional regulator [Acidimicrobiales bacterium]|nr:IclR family transcriptional regulator [Acidimicrobiales bacterium]